MRQETTGLSLPSYQLLPPLMGFEYRDPIVEVNRLQTLSPGFGSQG